MKKCVMFVTVASLFIMLSACTSIAKNQQNQTLTSRLTEGPISLKEVVVAPSTEEPAAPEEGKSSVAKEPFVVKEVIVAPSIEKSPAPEENKITQTKERFVLKEVIVAPPTEEAETTLEVKESAASSDVIGAESAATDEYQMRDSVYQNETDPAADENIRILVNTWLTSWESGDFDAYRNCYASNFRSKGMDLDAWIENKINVRKKSQNISISMDNLSITTGGNTATAEFNLHYVSSLLDSAGIKTLELKRTKYGWKIYKEIMNP